MKYEDALLEISRKSLEYQDQRYKDMDNKATAIITITGILISFLIGSGKLLEPVNIGSTALYILTAFSFLITVLLSILVIRVRTTKIFSTKVLIKELMKRETEEEKIRGIISTIADVEDRLRKICDKKG